MFAWYNVGFHATQLGHDKWHKCLEADLRELFAEHYADVVMLSECGEVDVGLGAGRAGRKAHILGLPL